MSSVEAVQAYATEYYPKHRVSLQELFDVTVHGWWSDANTDAHRFHVLFSYPEDADPDQVRQVFRERHAAANMPGFDPSVIRGVSVTMLTPEAASPLH